MNKKTYTSQTTCGGGKVEKKDEILKYEIAAELGLSEKVKKYGWKSLSAKETGRIGGLVSKKKKMLQLGKEK
jgi:small acid-soluble spore protein F (minor alpha/beta-type SASP)